ncbi:helix-turn-helix domain-containing protein [Turicibacter sanguinis]|nr:helix-turn-helix domain-containing protein [Turicibacter sanguinis]MTN90962.1 helix-turn-helix domain-containing protein [Turicibacter sanguinis]MTN93597.1 helix-turn-helix domain-containing protein [Turicibacter sanguinis]MTN97397.1 helix-turn-helix domain-containing protein [Turicibacter sanguinis]MTO02411.1 helix-turn-helix domain-containing protein [Turicibacter sanguinis]
MDRLEVKDMIKNRRLELGLSYSQFGELCGVDKTTVRKWELGLIENMRRDKMVLLSKALNVSPLVLLGIEDPILSQGHNQHKINIYANPFTDKLDQPIDEIRNPYPHLEGTFFGIVLNSIEIPSLLTDTAVYALFKKQSTAENGTIVAITIANNPAMIKKFYKMDDVIVLRSTTTEREEPITIVGDRVKDVCILGTFVGIVSPCVKP